MNKAKETEWKSLAEEIKEAINIASGAYATPLVDTITALSENSDSLRYMLGILKALFENKKFDEAIKFLHLLYDISGLNYPDDVSLIETNREFIEPFVNEFLLDLEDLMYDYY